MKQSNQRSKRKASKSGTRPIGRRGQAQKKPYDQFTFRDMSAFLTITQYIYDNADRALALELRSNARENQLDGRVRCIAKPFPIPPPVLESMIPFWPVLCVKRVHLTSVEEGYRS